MSLKRSLMLGLLCLAASSVQAQRVFVFPAPGTTLPIPVFTAEPFAGLTGFTGAPSPFAIFSNPDATKYYVVSKSANDTVVVLSSSFGLQVSNRFNFGVPAEAADISPDGRRLVVLAGTVHIIDTTTDQEVSNITLPTSVQPVDLAFSPDSTRVAILTRSTLGTIQTSPVYVIDLANPQTPVSNFSAQGLNAAISAAPNGLFYVTAANRIYELDRSGSLRPSGEISLNGLPSKLAFTPDGLFAVGANLSPQTGSHLLSLNIQTRTVTPIPFSNLTGITFDRVILLGNTRGIAYSPTTQKLYDINFNNLTAVEATFGATNALQNVLAVTTSNEFPTPRYLFIGTTNGLSRVAIANNLIGNPLPLITPPVSGTGVAFAGPSSTAAAAQIFGFNKNQSVAGGAQYQPLIVRVVDSNGQPVSGATVNFTSNNATALLAPANATTNAQGYAQTIVTAPNAVGDFVVTATSGGATTTFPLTVATAGGGTTPGGGAGTSGGLSIISGNGQGIRENFQSTELLAVEVRDTSGNVVPNANVVFTITSGSGTLQPGGLQGTLGVCSSAGQQVTCATDANGQAGVSFLASPIPAGFSFQQSTVSATYASNAVNFTLTTYVNALPLGGLSPDPTVQISKPTAEDRIIVAKAGSTVPAAVIAQVVAAGGPQTGQGIPNIGLRVFTSFSPDQGPSAFCNGPGRVALTDASGAATCDLVVGGRLGTTQLNVNVGAFNNQAPLTLTVLPGDPGRITIQRGNNQSGLPGAQLPEALVAVISDAFGNPLPGVKATFTVVTPGTVTLRNIFDTSDAQGRVSALATLGGTPGPQQVRVSVGNLSQTFTLTVNATFGSVTAVSGSGQTAEINQAFASPLVVRVLDTQGRPLPGAAVTFSVSSGSATLSAASAVTDANGQASVTIRAGATPGPITVSATAGGFTAAFNLTSRLPGPQLSVEGFVNAASFERGVVPGSIVTIFGAGIAPNVRGSVIPATIVGSLPISLAGVDVTFNGVAAPIFAVSNADGRESVTVQVPFETAPGQAQVRVNVSGGVSTISVPVQPVQPGFFETFDGTTRYVVAQRPDGSFVTPSNPARRGEVVRVYLTGLGQVTPATATNRGGSPNQRVNANLVLGLNYEGTVITSAEYAEGLIGVYVLTFTVPANAPAGSAIPLNMAAVGPDGQSVFSRDTAIAIQ